MTADRKDEISRKATLEIMAIILEEHNGYTPEEIKSKKLAEDCEGSYTWNRVYNTILSVCGKK